MPWYAITSLGIDGFAVKREIIFRDSVQKVWQFVAGRAEYHRIPDDVFGYFISDATTDETWDFDIDEPRSQSALKAVEVPLIFGEKLAPRN